MRIPHALKVWWSRFWPGFTGVLFVCLCLWTFLFVYHLWTETGGINYSGEILARYVSGFLNLLWAPILIAGVVAFFDKKRTGRY